MTRHTPLSLAPLLHISRNLREWDRREIFALKPSSYDEDQLAIDSLRLSSDGLVLWHGDMPAAAVGVVPLWPGAINVWAYGTEDFKRVALVLTRIIRRGIIPQMKARGVHRAECLSLDGHEDAQRWLMSMGARCEAVLPNYGRNRETFRMFCWHA